MAGALIFRMGITDAACVSVYADGKVFVNKLAMEPSKPVVVEFEGQEPNPEQIECLFNIRTILQQDFDFPCIYYDKELLPYFAATQLAEVRAV